MTQTMTQTFRSFVQNFDVQVIRAEDDDDSDDDSDVQVIRAEFLHQMLCDAIEVKKVNKIRAWLERRMCVPLLG